LGLRTKLFRSYRGNRSISNSSSITASVLPIPRALKNHIFAPPWVTPSARRLFGQAPALTLRHRSRLAVKCPTFVDSIIDESGLLLTNRELFHENRQGFLSLRHDDPDGVQYCL